MHPGARREAVLEAREGLLDISVREEAEHNQANERVRMLVALYEGVPPKALRLIKGRMSKYKIFEVVQ